MNKEEYLLKIKKILYAKELIKTCNVVSAYGEMFITRINGTILSSVILNSQSSIVLDEANSLMFELDIKEEYLKEIHEELNSLVKNFKSNDFCDLRYHACLYNRFLFEQEVDIKLNPNQSQYNLDTALSRVST